MIKMKNTEFVSKAIDIANNYKTLYVMGCFGAPMNEKNKARYTKNYEYNRSARRTKMINEASADTFGFDCVCLVKSILWGWNGDKNAVYGGAKYKSNGVPDIGTESMIGVCSDVSSDFSKIEKGELLWLKGHVGIYIGNGMAVECTPAWKNKVQITEVANIKNTGFFNSREWAKHGKLPYIQYEADAPKKIVVGSKVRIKPGVTKYVTGKTMASWVPKATLYVRRLEQNKTVALVSTLKTIPIYTGRVKITDIELI